ncbi:hypothetical protein [Pseudomonas viridiflava]|uniref:hypothetical protein n=1 Tax=Pseudomonas viridiflava TaxID=33069 RepID=UPI000F01D51C|nr:hypothetical protein [Pseudomonas viridiflava]
MILIALSGGSPAERRKLAELLVAESKGSIVSHAQEDTRGMLDARRVAMVDQVLGGWSRRIGLVLTHCLVEGEAERVRAKGGKVWHLYSTPSQYVPMRRGDAVVSLDDGVPAHVMTPLEAYSELVLAHRAAALAGLRKL